MAAEKVTANQALFDATVRHQVHVLRFAEDQAQEALKALKAAEGEVLEKITAAMAKGLEPSRLEALLVSIQERRQQVYDQLASDMKESLKEFAVGEHDWEIGALEGVSPVELLTASVPLEQLKAVVDAPIAGLKLDGWLNNISAAEATALQAAVTQAVLQGETIDDLVRRIRGTKAKDFADGILSTSTRNAQALARTAVNHVSNAARESVWEANSDIIRCLRWTSTLDGRTSAICRSRDGHMAPIGDNGLLPSDQPLTPPGARPPAHFNCRSLLVAVLDGVELAGDRPFVKDTRVRKDREAAFRKEAKERGVPIQQVRQEWAAKNVGQVPAATTYQEWLKKQPHEFQDEVLGAARADMFRNGMPLERFVDKSGKKLTLAQLQAEIAGDALNVLQPAIGVKAKGLLMQGLHPDEVLKAIQAEFPGASTTKASIASYKSQLNKAGLLPSAQSKTLNLSKPSAVSMVKVFEQQLPPGVKNAMQGQWANVVDDLVGHPGAYAHYKPGVGVELSSAKLATLPATQVKAIMAHELGHMLHKVHDVVPSLPASMKGAFNAMDPELKKLYGYYATSNDELWAEVVGFALHDGDVTSQGIAAGPFKAAMKDFINLAKIQIDKKWPDAPPVMPTGPVVKGMGEVPGKPTSIGGYAKALLQQGMPDDQVLSAVKAEFPDAKTSKASIASYKSQLKKEEAQAIGKSGPTVKAKTSADIETPKPVAPVPDKVTAQADPAAEVPKASGDVVPLSGLTKTGGKPGGSNPGGLYVDAKGDEWLIKGNLQKASNGQPADLSDARAKNEVLAAAFIRTMDEKLAPEMKLVDLEGQYGGGLGVMSKMLDKPIVKFDKNNPAHLAAAQEDFALHAWLGNWDAVGASYDNLVMKNGKAVNIDPGGALLFRAQGVPKDEFDDIVSEWNSMRKANKNPQAASVYGSMTQEQLVASAKRLMVFTDDKIDELVDAFGPGMPMTNEKLKKTLKWRRDDVLQNVGLSMPKKTLAQKSLEAAAKPTVNPLTKKYPTQLDTEQAKTFQEKLKTVMFDDDSPIPNATWEQALEVNEAWLDDLGLLPSDFNKQDIEDLLAWDFATGSKVSSADPTVLAAKAVSVADKKAYKKMSPKQLMDELIPPELEIKHYWGKTKVSFVVQKAAIPLFKAGLKTDTVREVLALKFGEQYIPKVNSLASMKSKLKKQGLLEGPIGASVPQAASGLAQPKLWGTTLGSKSTTVKEGAKNLIQQGSDAEEVVTWIGQQFSSPNAKGAQDLYELAYYEVKTGKAQVKPGVAATASHYNQSLPAPVPLRPASDIGEAGPPPPRFTPEGHRAGLQKYGGLNATNDAASIERINKGQRAAKLEELTPEEYAAIKAYTGSAYRSVNAKLRSGQFASDVYLQAWSDAAMQGLYKLPPWSGEVVRGMSVSAAEVEQLKKFYKVGSVVREVQFTSTSNKARGSGFGGNVRYHITTRSGRDVKPISSFKGEEEVLLVPGHKYKVTKVSPYSSNGIEIWMEEV